jgi:hypothetical protein
MLSSPQGRAIGESPRGRAPVSEISPFGLNQAHIRPIAFHPVGSGRKRSEMKKILVLAAVLYSAAAIAQTSEPAKQPMVGDKPLVQVKPKGSKSKDASKDAQPADAAKDTAKDTAKGKAAPGKPKSMAARLQACMDIDDGTKDRLNCYDAVIPPKPNPKAKGPAKAVTECNVFKDEEERLTCYNGFVEKLPKLPS